MTELDTAASTGGLPPAPLDGRPRDVRGGRGGLLGHHRWVTSIAAFSAGKAVPGLLTLVSIPIWIHSFGAAHYALFSLYWSASLIGTSLTLGWLKQAILRQTGNERMAYEAVPRRARVLVEAAPVLTLGPLILLTWPMMDGGADRWGFVAASCVGLLINGRYVVRQTIAQRDARATRYAVAETIRVAAALGVSVGLAASRMLTPWSLIAANVAGMLVALTLLALGERREPRRQPPVHPDSDLLGGFWRFGWPLSLWLALSSSAMYVDRFLIGHLYGLDRAGDYAAAADLVVRGMGMVVAPVIMFIHPAFMRAWNSESRAAALQTWRRMTLYLTLGTSVAGTGTFVAFLVVGDSLLEDPPSAATFGALVAGGVLWQLALMAHKPLEAAGRTKVMLAALLVSLLVTVGADLLLAPRLEVLGIALGFMVGALSYVGLVSLLDVGVLRAAQLEDEAA